MSVLEFVILSYMCGLVICYEFICHSFCIELIYFLSLTFISSHLVFLLPMFLETLMLISMACSIKSW